MKFEFDSTVRSLNRGVVPTVLLHIVVLTGVELSLVVRIIASKGVNTTTEMHSGEECFLLGQVRPDLDS